MFCIWGVEGLEKYMNATFFAAQAHTGDAHKETTFRILFIQ